MYYFATAVLRRPLLLTGLENLVILHRDQASLLISDQFAYRIKMTQEPVLSISEEKHHSTKLNQPSPP